MDWIDFETGKVYGSYASLVLARQKRKEVNEDE